MRFRSGVIGEITEQRRGLQKVTVRLDGSEQADPAVVLTDLLGTVSPGDRVVCNTTAVDLGLGTGGFHFVHWNLERTGLDQPGPDHVMKLRYTSLQLDAGTSEVEIGDLPPDLEGTPVVACLLHSQVFVVAAAVMHLQPGTRIVYVMTDGGALPLAVSDIAAAAMQRGVITAAITAGHAFGGDLEAVSVPSALLMARHHLGAEVIVVGMGPGVAGTATSFGTSAVDAAATIDSTSALGGVPILAVRASSGDSRTRHRGVSHHSRSVLHLCATTPLVASVPPEVGSLGDVEVVDVEPPEPDLVLEAAGLEVTTMGRSVEADPLFFEAAVAAGAVAAGLLDGSVVSARGSGPVRAI